MLGAVISLKGRGEARKGEVLRGVCNNSCRLFVDTCKSGGGEMGSSLCNVYCVYTLHIPTQFMHITLPLPPSPHHFLDTLNEGRGHEGTIATMPMLEEKIA